MLTKTFHLNAEVRTFKPPTISRAAHSCSYIAGKANAYINYGSATRFCGCSTKNELHGEKNTIIFFVSCLLLLRCALLCKCPKRRPLAHVRCNAVNIRFTLYYVLWSHLLIALASYQTIIHFNNIFCCCCRRYRHTECDPLTYGAIVEVWFLSICK